MFTDTLNNLRLNGIDFKIDALKTKISGNSGQLKLKT